MSQVLHACGRVTFVAPTNCARKPGAFDPKPPAAIANRGKPMMIHTDNAAEFTGNPVLIWARRRPIQLQLAIHGNAYVEPFNARLRGKCLNEHRRTTLVVAAPQDLRRILDSLASNALLPDRCGSWPRLMAGMSGSGIVKETAPREPTCTLNQPVVIARGSGCDWRVIQREDLSRSALKLGIPAGKSTVGP